MTAAVRARVVAVLAALVVVLTGAVDDEPGCAPADPRRGPYPTPTRWT